MRRALLALAIAGALAAAAGCTSSDEVQQDQKYLHLTAYDDQLSAIDVQTRIELGHEMCDALKRHRGDADAAEAEISAGTTVWTRSSLANLRDDAAFAYCPKYSTE